MLFPGREASAACPGNGISDASSRGLHVIYRHTRTRTRSRGGISDYDRGFRRSSHPGPIEISSGARP